MKKLILIINYLLIIFYFMLLTGCGETTTEDELTSYSYTYTKTISSSGINRVNIFNSLGNVKIVQKANISQIKFDAKFVIKANNKTEADSLYNLYLNNLTSNVSNNNYEIRNNGNREVQYDIEIPKNMKFSLNLTEGNAEFRDIYTDYAYIRLGNGNILGYFCILGNGLIDILTNKGNIDYRMSLPTSAYLSAYSTPGNVVISGLVTGYIIDYSQPNDNHNLNCIFSAGEGDIKLRSNNGQININKW